MRSFKEQVPLLLKILTIRTSNLNIGFTSLKGMKVFFVYFSLKKKINKAKWIRGFIKLK